MHTRSSVLICLTILLIVAGGIPHLAHADTAPGCPVIEEGNGITATGICVTVSGGNYNTANGAYATIGGGNANVAGNIGATIGGGHSNLASTYYSTIGGGYDNEASGEFTTVAAGRYNLVSDDFGTIGGGGNNQAGDRSGVTTDRIYATVSGGQSNIASGAFSFIGGGRSNQASGPRSIVVGGSSNLATNVESTVSGGSSNRAQGMYATVPGGMLNYANGANSFAAGTEAKAKHKGAFVWGDSTAADIASTVNNQFIARASGGVKFFSNAGATTGVQLPAGGGAWSSLSDRAVKANIAAVDSTAILDKVALLPVQVWNYTSQDASVRHIGPMAQDFAAAFGVGEDDRHISTVDADGVALAAIQGLNQKVEAKDAQIAALEQRLATLEAAQRGHGVTTNGLTFSWTVVVLGAMSLIVLLIVSSISLTLLFVRRRTTVV